MPSIAPLQAEGSARPHDHLLVRVGAERFAVPLAAVDEAVEEPRVSELPGASSRILGVLPVRGRRVPLHDAAPVFGIASARPARVALLFRGDAPVAVAVDELLDVATLDEGRLRAWSARGDVHGVVRAVTTMDEVVVAVVREEGVLAACGVAGGATVARGAGADA